MNKLNYKNASLLLKVIMGAKGLFLLGFRVFQLSYLIVRL